MTAQLARLLWRLGWPVRQTLLVPIRLYRLSVGRLVGGDGVGDLVEQRQRLHQSLGDLFLVGHGGDVIPVGGLCLRSGPPRRSPA